MTTIARRRNVPMRIPGARRVASNPNAFSYWDYPILVLFIVFALALPTKLRQAGMTRGSYSASALRLPSWVRGRADEAAPTQAGQCKFSVPASALPKPGTKPAAGECASKPPLYDREPSLAEHEPVG